ncbi:tyrosine-protein phosphatase [Staphylococcus saccharolyticus]|uniref:Tyrosine-protein phosphatase n=1 Tax=Staphylococcus saccharolyticus TaxID=33028 RepID=A0A380GZD8_9STAP|nr:CpsB/CapC family capsule biosynthesis tyrosine phosphatase [Staphylococcus saccharolyticus]MBL7564623.1 capsular biosynthesis protein [Staphylococcus saccharolyticus]MBL7571113.1 capsular biosynthesis protein [Staphylococcus saccharolyticus]QQB98959.1 capsular biosynthesis protein [Staphylococcus saccharolyticus]QRJ66828.1 capsular biosynthesis protein [Staphylococcus saccharolyticus]RTX98434.1 capsular biosynthesis protein [Staphylococcus saccharolyticus]
MIDIHNHILINVDDGPKSREEMLNLLKQAKSEGVTEIIATPHHLSSAYDNDKQQVLSKVEELLSMNEVQEIGIKMYPGQEIRITDQILPGLEDGSILSLNNSKYLLIELPSGGVPHYTERLFYELLSKGYVPIIAHPERNKGISQDLDKLYQLVKAGALSQLTTSSLLGENGKKIQKLSIQMLENNLTHFIASDAHHSEIRPFKMNSLFKDKKLNKFEKDLESFLKNAESVVNNTDIAKKQPTQNYKNKKFFGLF